MPRQTDKKNIRRLLAALLEGRGRKWILGHWGWTRHRYHYHRQRLLEAGAIVCDDPNMGAYSEGPNYEDFLAAMDNPTPAVQPGLSDNPTPPLPEYLMIEGAQYNVPVYAMNGVDLPTSPLANGVRIHRRRVTSHQGRVSVEMYFGKKAHPTVVLKLPKISIKAALLKTNRVSRAERLMNNVAQDATANLSRETGIMLGIPEPQQVDFQKTKDPDAVPLITGKLVVPIPGAEDFKGRIIISDTSEINGSPPGGAFESTSWSETVALFQLPKRILSVEKYQAQLVSMHERTNQLLETNGRFLEMVNEALERLNTFLSGTEERGVAGPGPEVR